MISNEYYLLTVSAGYATLLHELGASHPDQPALRVIHRSRDFFCIPLSSLPLLYVLSLQSFFRPPPPKPIRYNLLQKQAGRRGCSRRSSLSTLRRADVIYPSKFFSCNTYASPRKCCKQKTYGIV